MVHAELQANIHLPAMLQPADTLIEKKYSIGHGNSKTKTIHALTKKCGAR
jgi:hypothetical protein